MGRYSVNEYQLRLGTQRQVWLIPIADERVGVQVKLWNPSRTRAIPERFCGGDSLRRGAISSALSFTMMMYAVETMHNFWRTGSSLEHESQELKANWPRTAVKARNRIEARSLNMSLLISIITTGWREECKKEAVGNVHLGNFSDLDSAFR